jgi:hypothetical protein
MLCQDKNAAPYKVWGKISTLITAIANSKQRVSSNFQLMEEKQMGR